MDVCLHAGFWPTRESYISGLGGVGVGGSGAGGWMRLDGVGYGVALEGRVGRSGREVW